MSVETSRNPLPFTSCRGHKNLIVKYKQEGTKQIVQSAWYKQATINFMIAPIITYKHYKHYIITEVVIICNYRDNALAKQNKSVQKC
jgi:hypothetical protein